MTLSRCLTHLSHTQNPWSARHLCPWDTFTVPKGIKPLVSALSHCPCVYTRWPGQWATGASTTPPTTVETLPDLLAALQTGHVFTTPGATP